MSALHLNPVSHLPVNCDPEHDQRNRTGASTRDCAIGLDQTPYAERLLRSLQPPHSLSLPSRLVGSVLLSDGQLRNLTDLRLQQRPARQICFNRTLAALQLKAVLPAAVIEYAWSFGDDCEGVASVRPQSVYMDFNLEQVRGERLRAAADRRRGLNATFPK